MRSQARLSAGASKLLRYCPVNISACLLEQTGRFLPKQGGPGIHGDTGSTPTRQGATRAAGFGKLKRALVGPCVECALPDLPADDDQLIEVRVIGVVLVAVELDVQ